VSKGSLRCWCGSNGWLGSGRLPAASPLARGDGRYGRLLKTIGRVQLLILDDWGLSVLNASERRDLLEILDDRHGRASTIVTSQIPVEHWHDIIGDPIFGDAILDRARTLSQRD
jgi:DNA replication protein DnaC